MSDLGEFRLVLEIVSGNKAFQFAQGAQVMLVNGVGMKGIMLHQPMHRGELGDESGEQALVIKATHHGQS